MNSDDRKALLKERRACQARFKSNINAFPAGRKHTSLKALLLALAEHLNNKECLGEVAWPSLQRLGDSIGYSRERVKVLMRQVRRLGCFEVLLLTKEEAKELFQKRWGYDLKIGGVDHQKLVYQPVYEHPLWQRRYGKEDFDGIVRAISMYTCDRVADDPVDRVADDPVDRVADDPVDRVADDPQTRGGKPADDNQRTPTKENLTHGAMHGTAASAVPCAADSEAVDHDDEPTTHACDACGYACTCEAHVHAAPTGPSHTREADMADHQPQSAAPCREKPLPVPSLTRWKERPSQLPSLPPDEGEEAVVIIDGVVAPPKPGGGKRKVRQD